MTLQNEIETYNKLDVQDNKNAILIFLESLHHFMSCKKCKDEYCTYLAQHNPKCYPGSLFEWTVGLHNHVNNMLNKELWDIDEARKYYMSFLI
jgi:hypothetical protein